MISTANDRDPQYRILKLLASEGSDNVSHIAEALHMSRRDVELDLEILQNQGYVSLIRYPGEEFALVTITRKGRERLPSGRQARNCADSVFCI